MAGGAGVGAGVAGGAVVAGGASPPAGGAVVVAGAGVVSPAGGGVVTSPPSSGGVQLCLSKTICTASRTEAAVTVAPVRPPIRSVFTGSMFVDCVRIISLTRYGWMRSTKPWVSRLKSTSMALIRPSAKCT